MLTQCDGLKQYSICTSSTLLLAHRNQWKCEKNEKEKIQMTTNLHWLKKRKRKTAATTMTHIPCSLHSQCLRSIYLDEEKNLINVNPFVT